MKRFDVCLVPGATASKDRLVVVLQHEALTHLATTVVAPLFKPKEFREVQSLTPVVELGRQQYVVAVERSASIPRRQLGKPVGSLAGYHAELARAIDLLFSGF